MFGLFIRNHAEAVSAYNQVVVVYAHPTLEGKIGFSKATENGILTYRYNFRVVKNGFSKIFNPLRYLLAMRFLWKKIDADKIKIDVTHVHVLTRTGLLALYLKKKFGIPFIITEHWSRYLPQNGAMFTGALRKWLTRYITKQAFAVTTVTKVLADGMQQHDITNNNYLTVPNVVAMDRFVIGTANPSTKKVFLHVGCFDERAKNTKGLIRVVRSLAKKRSDFVVKLVGTGLDWQDAKSYAELLGLSSEHLQFTGLIVGNELVKHYQECEALILFSNYETQGVVLLEAFACGKPAIASNAGGIPEVMDPERGILVEAGNEEQLEHAMNAVLERHQFAEPAIIRKYVLDEFSNEAVGKKFHELYNAALKS